MEDAVSFAKLILPDKLRQYVVRCFDTICCLFFGVWEIQRSLCAFWSMEMPFHQRHFFFPLLRSNVSADKGKHICGDVAYRFFIFFKAAGAFGWYCHQTQADSPVKSAVRSAAFVMDFAAIFFAISCTFIWITTFLKFRIAPMFCIIRQKFSGINPFFLYAIILPWMQLYHKIKIAFSFIFI